MAVVSWKAAGNFESCNLRLLDDSSNSTRKNDIHDILDEHGISHVSNPNQFVEIYLQKVFLQRRQMKISFEKWIEN